MLVLVCLIGKILALCTQDYFFIHNSVQIKDQYYRLSRISPLGTNRMDKRSVLFVRSPSGKLGFVLIVFPLWHWCLPKGT